MLVIDSNLVCEEIGSQISLTLHYDDLPETFAPNSALFIDLFPAYLRLTPNLTMMRQGEMFYTPEGVHDIFVDGIESVEAQKYGDHIWRLFIRTQRVEQIIDMVDEYDAKQLALIITKWRVNALAAMIYAEAH